MRNLLAALLLVTPVKIQAKPEKAITLQDLLSPYVSDIRTSQPDFNSCANSFVVADENKDGVINEHEYTSFVAGVRGREFALSGYENLPLALKLNFVYLSCLCDDEINCCEVGQKGIATEVGVERVCAYTQMTVAYISKEKVESASPTSGRAPPSPEYIPSYSPLSLSPSIITTTDVSIAPSTSHSSHANLVIPSKTPSSYPSVDSARPSLLPTANANSNSSSIAPTAAHSSQLDAYGLVHKDSSMAPSIHVTNTDASSVISPIAPPSQSDTGDQISRNSSVAPVSSAINNLPPTSLSSSFDSSVPSPTPSIGWDEQYAFQEKSMQEEKSDSLSPAAILGVAAAVAIVTAAWVTGLFVAKRHAHDTDKALDTKHDHSKHDVELGPLKCSEKEVKILSLQVAGILSTPELETYSEDESDGSFAWCSTGLSSLYTGTFDSLTDDEMPTVHSTIVNMKAVSATNETHVPVIAPTSQPGALTSYHLTNSKEKRASREDLIAAIEAGDWKLVGATAALLASSEHNVALNCLGSVATNETDFSLDNSLASQFSRLVDSNDWEGVLAAITMLDGASDSESTTAEQLSPSELQQKADLQALIADLVKEVVPDEIDHLEEMLMQFHNREKELVDTLRMMQEKVADQTKHAKDETKC